MAPSNSFQSFYTHETDLVNKTAPRVSIRSDTLPLELRKPTPSDAPALLKVLSDEENIKHDQSCAGLDTLPAVENLIIKWLTITDPLERFNLVVVVEGKVVGIGGTGYIHDRNGKRVGDVGIMLNPEARGKGYAHESLRMTIDHALRVLCLDGVTISCQAANVAMRGLLEKKFGLSADVLVDGKFGNACCYSVKREEWLARRDL